MTLIILTESPKKSFFSVENLKSFLRRLLKKARGPQAVTASFLRGLRELGIEHKYNPHDSEISHGDSVWVNESLDALSWSILAKKNRSIAHLFTGPNLVTAPDDAGGIIGSDEIDKIFFPSQWTKDFYVSMMPNLAGKISICPSGVAVPPAPVKRAQFDCLLYVKNTEESALVRQVEAELAIQGASCRKVEYGKYDKEDYYDLLEKCKFMVYISHSESQGIALQEAWVRDVPTLVWTRGYMEHGKYRWSDPRISAPLMTDVCGKFFVGLPEFKGLLRVLISGKAEFTPRQYVLRNLTDKICAEKIFSEINSYK